MAQDFEIEKNRVYAQNANGDLTVDIYLPKQRVSAPAVLVLFPGGWDSKAADMNSICKKLASEGFVAFNLDYSLAPEFRYPQPIEDVRKGIQWVRQNAVELKVNADKIFLWGYSAGGHLAMMAGLDSSNKIQAVVSGGAPTDFPAYPHSPIITKFIGKTFDEAKDVWSEASPISHVTKNSPPIFMYHGEWDGLVGIDQMEKMASKLKSLNVPVETHRVSFLGHALVYLLSSESEQKGIDFLKKFL